MTSDSSQRCEGCGATLDEEACAGWCKGCRQPERVEAMLAERKDAISALVLHIGRRFGWIPGRDDDPHLRRAEVGGTDRDRPSG